ncbi:MAG: hypothetical protein LBG80_10350 [Bacteroidales bacterium]|jgi:hypothetical protein|nr:hypothetical protein [Bacteroidales bacterium]
METTDILNQKTSTLEVTENAKAYLSTAASWAKFYAIISFILTGFFVLCGLLVITVDEFMPMMIPGFSTLIGLVYIVLAVITFFPALYLLWFSQKTQKAILNNDAQILEVSFRNMKSFWKFIGIMTIILIAVLIIFIPISAVATAASGF